MSAVQSSLASLVPTSVPADDFIGLDFALAVIDAVATDKANTQVDAAEINLTVSDLSAVDSNLQATSLVTWLGKLDGVLTNLESVCGTPVTSLPDISHLMDLDDSGLDAPGVIDNFSASADWVNANYSGDEAASMLSALKVGHMQQYQMVAPND